jgi:predicted acetyltransferase
VYWFTIGDKYIGSTRIAPVLNEKLSTVGGHIAYEVRPTEREKGYGTLILKEALLKAKELGLERVLMTCDVTNEASRKIIEGSGGVFESTVPNPEIPYTDRARFWIDLKKLRS